MSINDGGPAFPAEVDGSDHFVQVGDGRFRVPGMSLRDYFAGQALAGIVSDPGRSGSFRLFASDAYSFADAMIAQRAKS